VIALATIGRDIESLAAELALEREGALEGAAVGA
jgi:hypothetical protein